MKVLRPHEKNREALVLWHGKFYARDTTLTR